MQADNVYPRIRVSKPNLEGRPLQYEPPYSRPSKVRVATGLSLTHTNLDDRVVLVTGGAGTICSAQTRALVRLGANACIIGRNVEKTEKAAKDIATARKGARVIGIGGCDVRSVSEPRDLSFGCLGKSSLIRM